MSVIDDPNAIAGATVPVIPQESYSGVRVHVVGTKLYMIWDVWKPGLFLKVLDHCAYMTIQDGKFVVKHCREGVKFEFESEIQPLVDIESVFRPRLSSTASNVVGNLVANQPELGKFAGWQIDMASRAWAISEDYPDESKLVNWIPSNSPKNMFEYAEIQRGDLARSIAELEAYIGSLTREKKELQSKLDGY